MIPLDWADFPTTFEEPWEAHCVTHLTINGSSKLSAAIVVEMQGCQERPVEKVAVHMWKNPEVLIR